MADGNGTFGGGGSVKWSVDVNDGEVTTIASKPNKPRGYVVSSLDKHEGQGKFFEVSIEIPASGVSYKIQGGTVKIYLEIVPNTPKQIDVHWALPTLPGGLRPLT